MINEKPDIVSGETGSEACQVVNSRGMGFTEKMSKGGSRWR